MSTSATHLSRKVPESPWPADPATVKQIYDEAGFVVLRSFLEPDVLRETRHQLDLYRRDVVPHLPPMDVLYQQKGNPNSITMMARMAEHSPYFAELLQNSPFRRLADLLLPTGAQPRNAEYFDKPPRSEHATPPHQDGYYFHLDPCEALTIWLALDEVDGGNGCVRYVTKSHRAGMRPHGKTGVLGFSQGIVDYGARDEQNEVLGVVAPGDVIVHDALTIHRADANDSTGRSRRAIAFVYFSNRAQVDHATAEAYHAKLEQEWKAQGRI